MSIYDNHFKRIFVVGQLAACNSLEIDVTAYSVSRWIACSHVTARKMIFTMVEEGILVAHRAGHNDRFVFFITNYGMEYLKEYTADYIKELMAIWDVLRDE